MKTSFLKLLPWCAPMFCLLTLSPALRAAPQPQTSSCDLSHVLPNADKYWALGESDSVKCAGDDGRMFGGLFEVTSEYNRFKKTIVVYFNPAASCGGGDGSSSEGCPLGFQLAINQEHLNSGQTCTNPESNPNWIELSQELRGELGTFKTFKFSKTASGYVILLERPDATCQIEVKDFKPDDRN